MAALFELLFWPIIIVFLAFEMFAVESRRDGGLATAGLAVFAVIMIPFYSSFHEVVSWISEHASSLLTAFLIYVAVGIVYAPLKWFLFVRKAAEYLSQNGMSNFAWKYGTTSIPFKASEFKGQIILWIVYWPFSAVTTIITDPMRFISETVYQALAGFLQRISDSAFSRIPDDVKKQ